MTATQSFRIHKLLHSYLIDDDEARLIISEIEQVLTPKKDNDISIKKNELVSKKTDSLKLQLEKERKFSKNILWIISAAIGIIFILLIIYKLFIIK